MQHQREIPYRKLFDTLDEGFAVLERANHNGGQPDSKCVDANPILASLTGAVMPNVSGSNFCQAFPYEPPEKLGTYEAVCKTGVPVRFERGLANGRTVEMYAFRIEDKPPNRLAILVKDITERKEA